MATDFNHHLKQQDVLDQTVDELYENVKQYAPFYQGTKKQMIKKAELYAEDASKVYTDDIVNVIVCATANVIGYNLAIFQNIGGQASLYSHNVLIKIQAIHCTSSMITVQVLIVVTITAQ